MCNRNVPGIKNMMTVTGDPRMKANCSLTMFAHLKISARLHKALRMAGSMTNFAAAVSLLLLFVHPGFRHQALAQTTASQGDFLQPQNVAPADVGVGKLSWDSELAAYAHRYAERRSHDCALVHSRGPYGENIYRGSGPWLTRWRCGWRSGRATTARGTAARAGAAAPTTPRWSGRGRSASGAQPWSAAAGARS
jgi:hypothetical protein